MNLTPEQIEAARVENRRAAAENRAPDPAAYMTEEQLAGLRGRGAPPSSNGASSPSNPDIFTAADLPPEDLGEWAEFTMPNGKAVHIAALSGEDYRLLLQWSGHIRYELQATDSDQEKQAKTQAATIELQALQVILCCYKSRRKE